MLKFPELPFGLDALEPFYSRRTLEYHHGKHHLAYVTNCNALIEGTPYEQMAVEELIRATASAVSGDQLKIFRNASQSWNHSFFWSSITPQRAKVPQGPLADHIEASFGSFDNLPKVSKPLHSLISALAGSGCSRATTRLRSRLSTMPKRHLLKAQRHFWSATCGSMPITWTTRTIGQAS